MGAFEIVIQLAVHTEVSYTTIGMNTKETIVTQKGTTTIPEEIRRSCGIEKGAVLVWTLNDGVIEARKKESALNAAQRHILARAGTWDGDISGVELLKKTRP